MKLIPLKLLLHFLKLFKKCNNKTLDQAFIFFRISSESYYIFLYNFLLYFPCSKENLKKNGDVLWML